jgi:hypothetical protein
MLNYEQEFFKLYKCKYNKKSNTACLVFLCTDNFEAEIPTHEKSVTRQLLDLLGEKVEIEFDYIPQGGAGKPKGAAGSLDGAALERLAAYADNLSSVPSNVDKTLKVKGVEYLLGRPINIRPVKIKHLRVGPDAQVTAGVIHFLTKREYKRVNAESGAEEHKAYWTFSLNDGADVLQCVFFPSEKTGPKFDRLVDRMAVCVTGVLAKRQNGNISFRVLGISFCEMA